MLVRAAEGAGALDKATIYKVAELAYEKFKDMFDGTGKAFEDFRIDSVNQMTYTAMAGKGEAEREATSNMLTIIERSAAMTIEESKNLSLHVHGHGR